MTSSRSRHADSPRHAERSVSVVKHPTHWIPHCVRNDTSVCHAERSEASMLDSSLTLGMTSPCHAERSVSAVKHPCWIPHCVRNDAKGMLGMTDSDKGVYRLLRYARNDG